MSSSKGLGTIQLNTSLGNTVVYVDQKKLFEDIKFMILTPKGSVIGYPEYGSEVLTMMYKQGTSATLDLISSAVYDVLIKFNGVSVLNVTTSLSEDKTSAVVKYDIIYIIL